MCGIAGIVHLNQPIDRDRLARMCQVMEHRGPDDHGIYIARNSTLAVGLGSRRLRAGRPRRCLQRSAAGLGSNCGAAGLVNSSIGPAKTRGGER